MDLSERAAGMDAEHLVFGGVFAVANRLQRTLDAAMPELTAKQWWLLVMLQTSPGPPTLTELAEAADTSHQNVRQILDRLEAKGFVRLAPDEEDARATRIHVTAKARRWGADTDAEARRFMAAMYRGLTPTELDALGKGLALLHSNLSRLDGPSA
ncbi:MAG: MarR family transcriptional regulator [Actinomyces sp.]|jgi:DNA-binding MarR family transcriptional regulator|nr:MarR family transcriptional regulator [Actinomyces sp.]MCI1640936.1 MarR family transcriptional regulator [Actinomyces sp.]MCI1661304.1 MarR family transcriptional regulator [Actinomyces sp.]MCI1690312.1 MarR family transcriptional regulator [Actinomyces sp.]MCI1786953.1 MarR family transcriptional regulator [Actinomyces sp.]MCI1829481.1 MarR family transcriptional regulator [Actinomyces sp.]